MIRGYGIAVIIHICLHFGAVISSEVFAFCYMISIPIQIIWSQLYSLQYSYRILIIHTQIYRKSNYFY